MGPLPLIRYIKLIRIYRSDAWIKRFVILEKIYEIPTLCTSQMLPKQVKASLFLAENGPSPLTFAINQMGNSKNSENISQSFQRCRKKQNGLFFWLLVESFTLYYIFLKGFFSRTLVSVTQFRRKVEKIAVSFWSTFHNKRWLLLRWVSMMLFFLLNAPRISYR